MESQIVIIGISFLSRKSYICRRQGCIRPTQRPFEAVIQISKYSKAEKMSYFCIACQKEVDGCRHAISCDVCERWQYRLCGTGMCLFIYFAIIFAITDFTVLCFSF